MTDFLFPSSSILCLQLRRICATGYLPWPKPWPKRGKNRRNYPCWKRRSCEIFWAERCENALKCPLKISDQPSGPRGLGFESRHSDQIRKNAEISKGFRRFPFPWLCAWFYSAIWNYQKRTTVNYRRPFFHPQLDCIETTIRRKREIVLYFRTL